MQRAKEYIVDTRNRVVYDLLSLLDRKSQLTLINYGYKTECDQSLPYVNESEKNSLRLYLHVASGVPIKGKDVIETGSGRGRGAHLIASEMNPRRMEAIDISPKAIDFSQKHFKVPGLRYSVGNARNIEFFNESFDVAINIESSHWYGNTAAFFKETSRVLKNNGHLLFADFRNATEVAKTEKEIKDAGFTIILNEDITRNVLAALDSGSEYKRSLIGKIPKPARGLVEAFAGIKGSTMYDAFASGRRVYKNYILQKLV